MRASEIIDYVDTVEPNQFDAEIKLKWLRELDQKVYEQLVKTHEAPIVENWQPLQEIGGELLIPEPYAREVYEFHLRMKIAASNLEDVRYNQHSLLFNRAWSEFERWYIRTHRALPPRGGNRFRL